MKIMKLFSQKCPRCDSGRMFVGSVGFGKQGMEMHSHCQRCGFDFVREPGFYTGAMYVSYTLDLMIGATLFVLLWLTGVETTATQFILSFSTILVVLFPWVFRTSRAVWLRLFG